MTVQTDAVVDAVGALRAWINSRTGTLVGDGKPLALGAWIGEPPRSTSGPRAPYRGAYAVLSRVGGGPNALDAPPWDYPRISARIGGVTHLQASTAATAYANELLTLDGQPRTVTWTGADDIQRSVILLSCDQIVGPLEIPGTAEPTYLVDAVVVCTPA